MARVDVRTNVNVGDSRLTLTTAMEEFERGNFRVGTVQDMWRAYLRCVKTAQGEKLDEEIAHGPLSS